ncbi:MAG: hypothetical protein Q7R78_02000 [bacterium]|nr:hypothetical protein [bacterium]
MSTENAVLKKRHLPETRQAKTHCFNVVGYEGYITVGFFEDGKPAELFITMEKEGPTVQGLLDTIAAITSISLRYGVPIEDLIKVNKGRKFEPSGATTNAEIRFAHSVVSYIFEWIEKECLSKK